MGLVSQPIAVAAEVSKSKLVADPDITVMELYQSMDRFLSSRGTNDLVALMNCMQGKSENDTPTKFGPVFLELRELLLDLIKLCPNTVLPRIRLIQALEYLNQDRRWHYANRTLSTAATEVHKEIRTALSKLRQIAQSADVLHRFLAKVSVPNEFVAFSHRMRINSDQW